MNKRSKRSKRSKRRTYRRSKRTPRRNINRRSSRRSPRRSLRKNIKRKKYRRSRRNKMKGGSRGAYVRTGAGVGAVVGGVMGGVASLTPVGSGNLGKDIAVGAGIGTVVGAKAASNRFAGLLFADHVSLKTYEPSKGDKNHLHYLGKITDILHSLLFDGNHTKKCPYNRTKVVELMDKLITSINYSHELIGIFPDNDRLYAQLFLWQDKQDRWSDRYLALKTDAGEKRERKKSAQSKWRELGKKHRDGQAQMGVVKVQPPIGRDYPEDVRPGEAIRIINKGTDQSTVQIIRTGKEGKLPNDSILFTADGGDGSWSTQSAPPEEAMLDHRHHMKLKLDRSIWGLSHPIQTKDVDAYVTHCMTLFPATGGEKLYISRLVYINKSAQSYSVEFLPSYYLKDLFPAVVPQANVQVAPELDRWRISPEISVVSST